MANDDHVALLMKGPSDWNAWREENTNIRRPDLNKADLHEANLRGADLHGADLYWADLHEANLRGADLRQANLHGASLYGAEVREANLSGAYLYDANLSGADLHGADLRDAYLIRTNLHGAKLVGASLYGSEVREADLSGADLHGASLLEAYLYDANLSGADLHGADLRCAALLNTDLTGADLTGCHIWGVSAWGLKLKGAKQQNLVIRRQNEPEIIVDDLEVAQFIYLLVNREKIRNVIDAVTRRGILILGRFEDGGLALLQAVAAWLRKPENGGYLPLLFDFPRPESKTYTDTIRTMVGLARFVIVELSGPSVPQEITATVDLYEIPFVPILEEKRKKWSMFKDFLVKERVLNLVRFTNQDHLLEILAKEVIAPAERLVEKRQERLDEIFGRSSLRDRRPRAVGSRRATAKSGRRTSSPLRKGK
jgi:uncharacterized protein YjbI with pentapeptide repeats